MGIKDDYKAPAGNILPGLKLELSEALNRLERLFASKGVLIAYLFKSYKT